MTIRYLIPCVSLFFAGVALAETPKADVDAQVLPQTETQKANRNACLRLGVMPNAPEMAACMTADSRSERIRIADRSVDGTN